MTAPVCTGVDPCLPPLEILPEGTIDDGHDGVFCPTPQKWNRCRKRVECGKDHGYPAHPRPAVPSRHLGRMPSSHDPVPSHHHGDEIVQIERHHRGTARRSPPQDQHAVLAPLKVPSPALAPG